jgi:hypothetical protein
MLEVDKLVTGGATCEDPWRNRSAEKAGEPGQRLTGVPSDGSAIRLTAEGGLPSVDNAEQTP